MSASNLTHTLQADSKYDVVRALLAATPAKGVQRYDFARSLVSKRCWGDWSLWKHRTLLPAWWSG